MKKYKNVSGQNVGFLIDGKTYDFQNNEIVYVPDNFKERVEGLITKIVPYEEPKPEPVAAPIEEEPKEKIKEPIKYTEKELFAMKKAEQVEILKIYGVTEIPTKEADRIKLILKLQKG